MTDISRRALIGAAAVAGMGIAVAAPALAQAATRSFGHDGGTSDIPVSPQRIVSLHDYVLTLPLLELGVVPVATHARANPDGSFYIRAARSLLGKDIGDLADTVVVATDDLEAIAGARPDLIIATAGFSEVQAQLGQIAPTVLIDNSVRPNREMFRMLADATGTLPRWQQLEARYESQIGTLKAAIPNASEITVSVMQSYEGVVNLHSNYGGLSQVLRDVGFKLPAVLSAIGQPNIELSAERLREADGDFMIDTYRNDVGQTPDDARAALAQVLPAYREFLHAARNNQHIAIPRDEAFANSYRGFEISCMDVLTHIAGREFVPMQR